jgi:hypothetical protein
MTFLVRLITLIIVAFSLALPNQSRAAQELPRISKPPLGERWFIISKNKDQSGYNRIDIRDNGNGYDITVESGTKFSVLGFKRECSSSERYQVNRDLTLKYFEVEEQINGKAMKLKGEVGPEGVKVSIISDSGTKEKLLKVKEPVYPPPAINIYPLMSSAEAGKVFHVKMLDVEKVKVIGVKITVIGLETSPGGSKTVHMQNDLYTFVDNDIWVDINGSTVREIVSRVDIVTQVEDGDTVRKFMATRPWLKKK